MTWCLAAVLAVSLADQAGSDWPLLRDVLQKHEIDAACCDDAAKRITSYQVRNDSDWFGIAYYWHVGETLPPELRVRTYDRRTRRWRSAIFDADKLRGGSAVGLARAGGWIYLDLHINPSAGSLIVLSETLKVRRRLYGWSSLILPDGRVVYEHSMVHFAPFHSGSVGLYDPRTDRDVRLFPEKPDPATVERPFNRFIHPVQPAGRHRIQIGVVEQELVWKDNVQTEPRGKERKFAVVCDLSRVTPRCVRRTEVPVK